MTPSRLTNQDYCNAAKTLNCEVAGIQAVASVESSGGGYDDQGRLKVRFEGHVFQRLTHGRFDRSNPNVSYPYKLMKLKKHGYDAFNEAYALDPEAALMASSWGMFQPLAENYHEAGFNDVHSFVDYLRESEGNQLDVFCKMVIYRHIDDEIQRHDWAGFAVNYNGTAYRAGNYDGRMATAYKQHKANPISCL